MNALQYPDGQGSVIGPFLERYHEMPVPSRRVLELGTKRWGRAATHHKALLGSYAEYVCSDIEAGADVDYVCDAHKLAEGFGLNRFSVILACSVWEHLEKPWVAAREIEHVLKPGGLFFVQTHFVFPEHGYPHDYTRWTTKGLQSLFDWASDVICAYEFPAKIAPHDKMIEWNDAAPAFLNVCITGRKS